MIILGHFAPLYCAVVTGSGALSWIISAGPWVSEYSGNQLAVLDLAMLVTFIELN
jgi:hypothetical protein